jgi:hypothetical protein
MQTHGDVQISSMQSSLWQQKAVNGHLHIYAALFLNNNAHVDGGWVAPRVSVDAIQRENHCHCP